jgi:glutamine amidotransferase
MINIIDIQSGNVRTWVKLFERLLIPYRVVGDPNALDSNTILLPGVGSAGYFMEKMKSKGFFNVIKKYKENKLRIIGICLGFQLLTEFTEEDGGIKGLGLIKGHTEKLKKANIEFSNNGWSNINIRKDEILHHSFIGSQKLTKKSIVNGRVFFNHEYGVKLKKTSGKHFFINKNNASDYVAAFFSKNLIGIQFHPEKSQKTGIELIKLIL